MPYYAVAKGRSVGVYSSWSDCKKNVSGYPGATYKKFATQSEAEKFVSERSEGGYGNEGYSSSRSMKGERPSSKFTEGSCSGGDGRASHLRGGYPREDYNSGRSSSSSSSAAEMHSHITLPKPSKSISNRPEIIYVDGAARGNGKNACPKSGYGVYYGPGDTRNSSVPLSDVDDVSRIKPTNQRAELHAMHHALQDIHREYQSNPGTTKSFEIHTDSTYTKKAIDTWANGWKNNNWKTSTGSRVANQDLIERTHNLYCNLKKNGVSVDLVHVKGHLGIEGNEQADRLANQGADRM